MASCCEAPKSSNKADLSSESIQKDSGITAWVDNFAPIFSALLHSSCCWLPTLLDLTSIGSASAATVSSLRPVFSTVTILILLDSIRRQGLNRRNLLRILVSALVLVFPKYPHVSCLGLQTRSASSQSCNQNPNKMNASAFTLQFWSSRLLWKRAGINTLRCLVGCTIGDFSMMWFLQSQYPGLGIYTIMGLSMASGIASSMSLETMLLRYGIDKLPWRVAVTTAAGMSLVSMLSMEAVENMVDYHLMGGVVDFANPKFWTAAATSAFAGFLAPLPYNYMRLRKYGRACH